MKGWKRGNGRKFLIRDYIPKKKPREAKPPRKKRPID